MDQPIVIRRQIHYLGLGKNVEKFSYNEVGAEDGKATIPLSMFHAHKVIAIEPNIYSHVALLNNLELNNICSDKVEPLNIAISTQYSNKYQKDIYRQTVSAQARRPK